MTDFPKPGDWLVLTRPSSVAGTMCQVMETHRLWRWGSGPNCGREGLIVRTLDGITRRAKTRDVRPLTLAERAQVQLSQLAGGGL